MATKHKLGRIRPKFIAHGKRFTILVHHDGSVTVVPRLGFHYDRSKDTAAPAATNWMAKMAPVAAQVYGNAPDPNAPNVQPEGDCVIASILKVIGGLTANESGTPALSSSAEALREYQTICGPGDEGCVITDVLDYAKANGVTLSGVIHKIDNYVSLDTTDYNLVQVAVEVFGPAVKFGVNLPNSWDQAVQGNGFVWDVPSDPNDIVGGHDVPGVDAAADGVTVLTWGYSGKLTKAAMADTAIVDECYVLLAPDWYANGNLAPNGINAATLAADLALVGQGTAPVVGPTPPPTPPGPPVPPAPAPTTMSGVVTIPAQTIRVPHLFGTVAVTIPAQTVPVTVSNAPVAHQVGANGVLIALLLQYGAKILPIVLADLAAGKTWPQILADVAAALIPTPAPAQAQAKRPCGC